MNLLPSFAASLVLASQAVIAQEWRAKVPEVRFAVSSSENSNDAVARYEPFGKYLSERLGVNVKVFRTPDYAAQIEALNAGQVEFARIGPANYALGYKVMGARLEPLLIDVDLNESRGYYSILAVRSDSPYKSIGDLKGKPIIYADPNSTSGYAFPLYFMKKEGYDPATYFGKAIFSGGHENGVLALLQGTAEVAATYWTNEERGNIQRMVEKKMIPDGKTRVIWKSPIIPNGPWVARADLPAELKAAFVAAVEKMPLDGPEAWQAITNGQVKGVESVKHADYLDVIAVTLANEADRKKTN